MGGGTFVDGVRRWFQRRPTSVANTSSIISNNEQQPHPVLTETLSIVDDFDISGLKLIKVPKRLNFPLSNSSMDSHKKVAFFSFLFALLLWICFSMLLCLYILWLSYDDLEWYLFVSLIDTWLCRSRYPVWSLHFLFSSILWLSKIFATLFFYEWLLTWFDSRMGVRPFGCWSEMGLLNSLPFAFYDAEVLNRFRWFRLCALVLLHLTTNHEKEIKNIVWFHHVIFLASD